MDTVTATSDAFVRQFFGPNNVALPGGDLDGPRGPRIQLYLAPLLAGVRRAMILPRTYADGRTDAYIVAWDPAEATRVRRLIEAFIGHSFIPFDGRLSRLREDDPVDAAVISLVGPNTTYILRSPDFAVQQALWQRLATLRDLLNSRPERMRAIPRPLGRLLAELRIAVAGGAAQTSAELLDELAAVGGISPLNLAYLRVYRLGRLGRSSELLRLPELDDVVTSQPPGVVAEAILDAWVRVELDVVELATADDVARVVSVAERRAHQMASLCVGLQLVVPSVRLAAAIVCLARRDAELAARLLPADDLLPDFAAAIAGLISGATDSAHASAPSPMPQPALPVDPPCYVEASASPVPPGELVAGDAPRSWVEWVKELGSGCLDPMSTGPEWSQWPQPVDEDREFAAALDEVGTARADSVWGVVGPFLDADTFDAPAWRTAGAFLIQATAYDRWAPADLVSVQALLEIFTRGAPGAADYAEMLELVGSSVPRWVSVANVERALDIIDVLARVGCPDPETRLRFITKVLEPLHRGRWRLAAESTWLAGQIDVEVGLNWDWSVPRDSSTADDLPEPVSYEGLTILVYSLDPGALQRTVDGLTSLAPGLKIHRSSHKAGTNQLRDQTRSADAIALATRSAKHAATGFIRQYARPGAVIREADGAGSATLLRAALAALRSEPRNAGPDPSR